MSSVVQLEGLPTTPRSATRLESLSRLDVEALRLILQGKSVIDWPTLAFSDRVSIDRFLRLCRFDPDSPADQAWMRGIVRDAVAYLRESFHFDVPKEIAEPADVQTLFLTASGFGKTRLRKMACIVLKVCHVIYHIEARDLFHRLPLAEEAFGEMAEREVMTVFAQLKSEGLPIRSAVSSAKSRSSLISKLLQKSDTVAARIYDRTRFRVVVEQRTDILPVLHALTQRLFPFHLAVPGQTQNSLIDPAAVDELVAMNAAAAELASEGARVSEPPIDPDAVAASRNEVSGTTYRMLKFVVDLPLRIDERLITPAIIAATRARTVCCLIEIQIVDADTARLNEEGENEHEQYKHRQRVRIMRRLSRGSSSRKK